MAEKKNFSHLSLHQTWFAGRVEFFLFFFFREKERMEIGQTEMKWNWTHGRNWGEELLQQWRQDYGPPRGSGIKTKILFRRQNTSVCQARTRRNCFSLVTYYDDIYMCMCERARHVCVWVRYVCVGVYIIHIYKHMCVCVYYVFRIIFRETNQKVLMKSPSKCQGKYYYFYFTRTYTVYLLPTYIYLLIPTVVVGKKSAKQNSYYCFTGPTESVVFI